jgi:peptidyl-prolyl cis-trans isomerase C
MMHFLPAIAIALAPQAAIETVARVNGGQVTSAEVAERLAAARAAGSRQGPAQIVEDLVNEAVLADDGVRAGLDREPSVRAAGDEAARRAAVDVYLEEAAASVAPASEAQLRELYHAAADSVRLRQMTFATRAEAEAVLGRLRAGAGFADEARRSLDASAARAGDRGLLVRGQLEPALARLAFDAPAGAPAGPVELQLGWAVIVASDRTIGDEATFARRRPEIARHAARQQREMVRGHLVEKLRAQAGARLDEDFVRATGARIDATPAERERTVATVGSRRVRYGEVLERVRRLSGGRQGGHFTGASVKLELAWSLVDDLLLADAAVGLGLDRSPPAAAARRRAEREAVVRVAAERLRQAVPPPSSEDTRDHYRRHLGDFLQPARRACFHILVRDAAQAEALRDRLARGATWDAVAAEHSLDPRSAGKGGALGTLDDRQLDALAAAGEPALASALRTARPGAVVGPVKSRAGFHLVRTGSPQPPTVLAPEQVEPRIAARLLAERQERAVRARLAELRATARVEIDAAAVGRLEAQLTTRKEPTP